MVSQSHEAIVHTLVHASFYPEAQQQSTALVLGLARAVSHAEAHCLQFKMLSVYQMAKLEDAGQAKPIKRGIANLFLMISLARRHH